MDNLHHTIRQLYLSFSHSVLSTKNVKIHPLDSVKTQKCFALFTTRNAAAMVRGSY